MSLKHVAPLCLIALTPFVHADTYQFNFQGTEGVCTDPSCFVYTAQWQLTSTPDASTSTTATYYNLSETDNIGQSYGPYTAILETNGASGGQEIDFNDPFYATTDLIFNTFLPDTFFTGPTSSPTFLAGNYGGTLYSQGLSDSIYGTATITDLSTPTSPTPEPSTLALLGTGVLGAAGAVRRRLRPLR